MHILQDGWTEETKLREAYRRGYKEGYSKAKSESEEEEAIKRIKELISTSEGTTEEIAKISP